MKKINRQNYIETLRKLKDQHLIKVITGIRRSGKSTLLDMFREEVASSIAPARAQQYNFENPKDIGTNNWQEIYAKISSQLVDGKKNYVFIDEVQNLKEFERLLDGLYINENVDLYITGSNAYLLSSELATLLTGRSFEINILPFSFSEFVQTYDDYEDKASMFEDYMRYSSLPQSSKLLHIDPSLVAKYVREVYDSIFENDIIARRANINERAFLNIRDFAVDNIGNMVSPNSIAGTLAKDNKTVDSRTVDNYLKLLTDSYILYRVGRFDIKGKQHLATQEKYYLSDIGFRNALIGKELGGNDAGHILENIIYLELLRRGGEVWIGKVRDKEVDFVVQESDGTTTYYQVAYTVRDAATLEKELAPFDKINDHNLKILITMDPEEVLRRGVRQINAINFLLGEDSAKTSW